MIESSLLQSEPVALPERPSGSKVKSVAAYSLLVALMTAAHLLVFLPAALFHCAIRNGRRAAWTVALIGAGLGAVVVSRAVPAAEAQFAWTYLATVVLAVMLPSLVAIPLVERAEPFGRLVVYLLIGSMIGLAAVEIGARTLFDVSPFAAQVEQAKATSAALTEFYRSKLPAEASAGLERWADITVYVLPAGTLIEFSFMFILSLLMLGRLNAWRELASRRNDSGAQGAWLFRNFALPDWVLFAFVLGGLTPLASGLLQKIAANTLVVVSFLFVLQGLAIFRFLLVALGAGFAATMFGWLLLGFLTVTGVGPLLLGVVGLFDPFFDFRHPKKRKDDSHESHSD